MFSTTQSVDSALLRQEGSASAARARGGSWEIQREPWGTPSRAIFDRAVPLTQGDLVWPQICLKHRFKLFRKKKPAFSGWLYFKADSVGPEVPRGSRLTPEAWNNVFGFEILGSTRKPMKQFCISSQF